MKQVTPLQNAILGNPSRSLGSPTRSDAHGCRNAVELAPHPGPARDSIGAGIQLVISLLVAQENSQAVGAPDQGPRGHVGLRDYVDVVDGAR